MAEYIHSVSIQLHVWCVSSMTPSRLGGQCCPAADMSSMMLEGPVLPHLLNTQVYNRILSIKYSDMHNL